MKRLLPIITLLFLCLLSVHAATITIRANNSVNAASITNFCIYASYPSSFTSIAFSANSTCTTNGTIALTDTATAYNITLFNVNATSYSYCYQETANISTACGGLSTGTYERGANGNVGYFDANYTKIGGLGSIWQVRMSTLGIINYTVPVACWNAYTNKVNFRLFHSNSFDPASTVEVVATCWNGTQYVPIRNVSAAGPAAAVGFTQLPDSTYYDENYSSYLIYDASSGQRGNTTSGTVLGEAVYEEGMFWRMTTDTPNYYNDSITSFSAAALANITFNVTQSYLTMSAYRLYLNTSIATFNITNVLLRNTTTSSSLTIPANNGTNNLQVDVGGNYTLNVTCTVTTPLSVGYCNATGVYDNRFTIGANNGVVSVSTFTVNATNTTINAFTSVSTTNHSAVLSLLQGYTFQFYINAPGFAIANITQTPVASTSLYNFTLLTNNTFNLTFVDESTNTRINTPMSLSVISGSFAQNYTINNGTGNISFLTPNDYILRYSSSLYQLRDFYVTLQNQQYQNFTLYVINTTIASQVIVSVVDTANAPVANATVTLMRYFIGCNCYQVVEMERTSYSGQAIFWVEAINGYYKWSVDYQGVNYFLSTTAEQIDTSTRNFILNLGNNWYAGYTTSSTIASTLSFNRNTGALTFTFSDPTSSILGGCLFTDYTNGSTTYRNQTCINGITGSTIQILSHANTTLYRYQASINTSTTSPLLVLYSGTIEPLVTTSIWGNLGIFLALGVIMTVTLLFSVSPVLVIIVNGLGIIAISVLGIMPFTTTFLIGLSVTIIGLATGVMRR